jgi:RHS repeat-associated protein
MRYTSDGELDVTLKILYDTNGEAVGFTTGGAADTYLYEKNLYGDVTGIYDENGTKWLTYSYDAWGNATVSATGNTFAHIITYALLAALNPITYRGYQYDMETGLYYLQSRYYNPEWGRFLNADVLISTQSLLSTNVFAFCYSSPVSYRDNNGRMPTKLLNKIL